MIKPFTHVIIKAYSQKALCIPVSHSTNISLEGWTRFRVHSLFRSIFPIYEHIHALCPMPDAGRTECHRQYDHICAQPGKIFPGKCSPVCNIILYTLKEVFILRLEAFL